MDHIIMWFRVIISLAVALCINVALPPMSVGATDVKASGLAIAPDRLDVTVNSGKVSSSSLKIANYTQKSLEINFFVKQFSMTNYVYDYKFRDPSDHWIIFEKPQIELKPGEVREVHFAVNVPTGVSPGGHYFALFASADMSTTGIRQTAQVVSLLYLKVAGAFTQTGAVENGSVPFLVMTPDIPYSFNAKNTGNVDYSAHFSGHLEGLFVNQADVGTSHVLLPGTVRTIHGSVPAPLLPGVYKLLYGYKTDFGTHAMKTAYVLYLPPWFIVVGLLVCFVVAKLLIARNRTQRSKE